MKILKWKAALAVMVIGFCIYQVVTQPINLRMDLTGGTHLEVQVKTDGLTESQRNDTVEGVTRVLQTRIDEFILAESSIERAGNDRLIIQIPGINTEKVNRIKDIIKRQAHLEFRIVVDDLHAT